MERLNPDSERDQKIKADMETALKNGVHIDASVNPFLDEETRQAVINKLEQDPEWD